MALIVLWFRGGPSQIETFDPKPGKSIGGPTRAIKTTVPGIEIAEGLPLTAEQTETTSVDPMSASCRRSHFSYCQKVPSPSPMVELPGSIMSSPDTAPMLALVKWLTRRRIASDAQMKQSTCRYFHRDSALFFMWKSTRRAATSRTIRCS